MLSTYSINSHTLLFLTKKLSLANLNGFCFRVFPCGKKVNDREEGHRLVRSKGIIKTQIDFKSVITSRNPKYPHSIQAVMYLDYELQFNKIHTYFGIYL